MQLLGSASTFTTGENCGQLNVKRSTPDFSLLPLLFPCPFSGGPKSTQPKSASLARFSFTARYAYVLVQEEGNNFSRLSLATRAKIQDVPWSKCPRDEMSHSIRDRQRNFFLCFDKNFKYSDRLFRHWLIVLCSGFGDNFSKLEPGEEKFCQTPSFIGWFAPITPHLADPFFRISAQSVRLSPMLPKLFHLLDVSFCIPIDAQIC